MLKPSLYLFSWIFGLVSQQQDDTYMHYKEKQLTSGSYGHTIHNGQVFSPDNEWIVYDTRNDDTQIGSTDRIEMVNIHSAEVKELYRTKRQSSFGPGVGAASFSPVESKVLFIHGIRNADEEKPYSITRRTGVAIQTDQPLKPIFMDARDITAPYTSGALRGGTHAHSWSGDGKMISFTYNDAVFAEQHSGKAGQDLRTVGVMVPGIVSVDEDRGLENNSGTHFSIIAAQVITNPRPGTDEVDRAFDETWIGNKGYIKADGSRQHRAIAFQGNVHDESGLSITEVFVIDLPEDVKKPRSGYPLAGTSTTLPNTPLGVVQRRLTHGAHVDGPRHWLRSTPDGSLIFYLARDRRGLVQLFSVTTIGGRIRQITDNDFSIQGPFNVHPNGKELAYTADNSLFVTNILSGNTQRITPRFSDREKPVGAPVYARDGEHIAYNRYVGSGHHRFLQIFLLTYTLRN